MKRFLLLILLAFSWLLLVPESPGQALPATPTDTLFVLPMAGDTLPAITMKFEPAYILIYFLVPGTALFVGGHSYKIKEEMKILPSSLAPYFKAARDPLITNFYQNQKNYRMAWYVAAGAGTVVVSIGFAHAIASIFDPGNARAANNYLLLGGGFFLSSIGFRVACFRNMRKAVNLYNYKYATPTNAVSLELGLPSSTPAGLGLYVKF